MFKFIFKTLLVLSFTSAAFAQDANRNAYIKSAIPKYGAHRAAQKNQTVTTTTRTYKTAAAPQAMRATSEPTENSQTINRIEQQYRPVSDTWMNYLMHGMVIGFEYGQLGAEAHVEATYRPTNTSLSDDKSASGASALGVSAMYARLGRDSIGFSAGGTILQKIENDAGRSSGMANAASMTLFRPEANLLFGHNSGLWGGIGGNVNYVMGESELNETIDQLGLGLQARIGFVATRHFGFDLGYYASFHKMKNAALNDEINYSLDTSKSYLAFTQWSLRGVYLF